MSKLSIEKVLDRFQEGYRRRDVNEIDAFVKELFVDSEDTIIIGTGNGEWCKGIEEIKELVYVDWFYWGNFQLDLDNALIKVFDTHATVSTTAVLQKAFDKEKLNGICIDRIKKQLESEGSYEEKMYGALKSMAYFLHEENVGQDVKRKVRFSATLLNRNGVWQFSDLHFSYPVSPPTDVKVIMA